MSESVSQCPNCGSPASDFALTHWRCGSNCQDQAHRDKFYASATCVLIRSLREELAKARAELKQADLVNDRLRVSWREDVPDARDAERDQIADWLKGQARISEELWMEQRERVDMGFGEYHRGSMNAEDQAVNAIRNNEHRSNT